MEVNLRLLRKIMNPATVQEIGELHATLEKWESWRLGLCSWPWFRNLCGSTWI